MHALETPTPDTALKLTDADLAMINAYANELNAAKQALADADLTIMQAHQAREQRRTSVLHAIALLNNYATVAAKSHGLDPALYYCDIEHKEFRPKK